MLLSYSSNFFEENLPEVTEQLTFSDDISDKSVTIYCIDKDHTNPYRMWERAGKPEITGDTLKSLREEGRLKPLVTQSGSSPLTLKMTPNCTYLITVTK